MSGPEKCLVGKELVKLALRRLHTGGEAPLAPSRNDLVRGQLDVSPTMVDLGNRWLKLWLSGQELPAPEL
jgi:hypothetical protein